MLWIQGHPLDPRLVILDKDGTLIDFDNMWHAWFVETMALLEGAVGLDPALCQGIEGSLGVDLASDVWDPAGPLTLASTSEVRLLLAGQLYHHRDLTWDEALAVALQAEQGARASMDQGALLQPIGDVRGLLRRMRAQGIMTAMATTDERPSADAHLQALGLTELFDTTLCDGDGVALKPAPDMALVICERLGVAPSEAIMIGDTVADLMMARAAGLAAAIGVTSGAMPASDLTPHADWVLDSIHDIHVEAKG